MRHLIVVAPIPDNLPDVASLGLKGLVVIPTTAAGIELPDVMLEARGILPADIVHLLEDLCGRGLIEAPIQTADGTMLWRTIPAPPLRLRDEPAPIPENGHPPKPRLVG